MTESKFAGAVICADDDEGNRYLIKRLFGSFFSNRLRVYLVGNGQQALDLLPQVVEVYPRRTFLMSDVQMPDLNGPELVARVRYHPDQRISRMPLVLHTSQSNLTMVKQTIENALQGEDDFDLLGKPFDSTVFEATIGRVLADLGI